MLVLLAIAFAWMAWLQMEAGGARYELISLDVSALASTVGSEFQAQLGDGKHRIEISLDSACPRVRGDGEALGRALWNLLDNAVKYSPDSTRIVVETTRAEGGHVAIRIRDFGLGIAPAEQKEIFRKFVRGTNAAGRAIKGAGLGLALVDHIVRAHAGEIRLESIPGQGSTFTMILPVEQDAGNVGAGGPTAPG